MTMVIFTIIFGKFAKLLSDGVPYPLFSFCALLPWNYFSQSLSGSSDSLVGASNLITKVYFPRLVIPLSRVFAGLVDFVIAFVILLGLMVWGEAGHGCTRASAFSSRGDDYRAWRRPLAYRA